MEAKELMIGDWVLIGNNHIRITSLQEGKDYVEAQPIPLTAELLEKNGFECLGAWRISGEDIGFRQGGNRWAILTHYGANTSTPLCYIYYYVHELQHYVHQLQHALRLCGIDKEIVL